MRLRTLGPLGAIRNYSQQAAAAASGARHRPYEHFSLMIKGPPYQDLMLNKLKEYMKLQRKTQPQTAYPVASANSLLVLASRELASWLGEKEFMSNFLENFQGPLNSEGKGTLDVLVGVVDGLTPYHNYGEPQRGFSVFYGPQDVLPGLWDRGNAGLDQDPDRAASISFYTALPGEPFKSSITVPMANTIFENGRRSTLFATRYEMDAFGRMKTIAVQEKAHQDFHVVTGTGAYFKSRIPLIPLAPPRKIVAGLGNIVRQVEIDGVASPASKEIEELIPKYLSKRSRQDPAGVWALVIPPHVMTSKIFNRLHPFCDMENFPNYDEHKLVEMNAGFFWAVTRHGCRVHKILSGGGGWGAKAGLLSLDPETSYTAPEQESIDDFIEAFEKRNSGEASRGIVTPGSYIMFCAESDFSAAIHKGQEFNRGMYFGVADHRERRYAVKVFMRQVESSVRVVPQLFSAMSLHGVYLKLDSPGHEGLREYPFTSKIDVPHSFLRHVMM